MNMWTWVSIHIHTYNHTSQSQSHIYMCVYVLLRLRYVYAFAQTSNFLRIHYSDVIMGVTASQITHVSIVYSTVCSNADQRKHQTSASLAFGRIHRWPVNSPHNGPVTRKMFPFDDVIMFCVLFQWTFHDNPIQWSTEAPICQYRRRVNWIPQDWYQFTRPSAFQLSHIIWRTKLRTVCPLGQNV